MILTNETDPLRDTLYETVRLLRIGGMCEIYEVRNRASGEVFAAKILRDAQRRSPQTHDRMRLERDILFEVHRPTVHHHVVRPIAFGTAADGRPYLAMERLRGRTLQEIAAEGDDPMPAPQAIDIALQILDGLFVVHALGVVHRDLKPGNVFLSRPRGGRRLVKLIDFGLAKVSAQGRGVGRVAPLFISTADEVFVGTHRYTAPEQADPKTARNVDARADLYAVGLVLYTMLCGREPYYDLERHRDLLRAHIQEAIDPPSKETTERLSPELVRIMMKALAKNPADRFASAQEFSVALSQFVERHPSTAPQKELSALEHARMTAELEVSPERQSEILARYGVPSAQALPELHKKLEENVRRTPKLRKKWEAEVERHRELLLKSSRPHRKS